MAIKEKHSTRRTLSKMSYEENKPKAFERTNSVESSYRVYEDGKVGICYNIGEISDEEGFARAQADPERARPYPFTPEAGGTRKRDKSESSISDRELMTFAREYMDYVLEKYPLFTFSGNFTTESVRNTLTSDLGTDFEESDACFGAGIMFKHKDSRDIVDGGFGFNMRALDDGTVFRTMADLYLGQYETVAEVPEEILLCLQYYSLTGALAEELNAEQLALGTSRLTGKIGEKVFSEDFTLEHDVSDKEAWFSRFWDGEGCVLPEDKLVLIENGVVRTGYSDKRVAQKYGVEHTRTAGHNYSDLPYPGGLNLRIRRSDKTILELMAGRPAIIPMNCTGSPADSKGDMSMIVNSSLLWDGERVLGRLPEFRVKMNFFDMLGRDYIGVGSDDSPFFHDKVILLKGYRV
ncbi:MAG: hypothetical protein IKI15_00565 [Lachnospiraceae bacterium]|nr:hypothetical protein [Lachnospiraceae bacterium]